MKYSIITAILISLISCRQKSKFDTTAWTEESEPGRYPNRKFIVDDLVKNYKLKGTSSSAILKLLGQPFPTFDFKTDTMMLYPIDMKFDHNHHLISAKSLVLKFNKDSSVRDFEIKEWEK